MANEDRIGQTPLRAQPCRHSPTSRAAVIVHYQPLPPHPSTLMPKRLTDGKHSSLAVCSDIIDGNTMGFDTTSLHVCQENTSLRSGLSSAADPPTVD